MRWSFKKKKVYNLNIILIKNTYNKFKIIIVLYGPIKK